MEAEHREKLYELYEAELARAGAVSYDQWTQLFQSIPTLSVKFSSVLGTFSSKEK